jgi:hypothetical protein
MQQEPCLHITQWLGDIPVEGECTSCLSIRFQVKSFVHLPSREKYELILQRAFDEHFNRAHSPRPVGSTMCDDRHKGL